MSIQDDDPLGAFLAKGKGKGAPKKSGLLMPDDEDDDMGDGDTEMTGAAQSFIDAVHAKDAGATADAFRAMSGLMKPPGEDDMDMAPSSAEGAMVPGD